VLRGAPGRVVVLVDGEHHPSVLRGVVDDLRAAGVEVVGAADLGGSEKRGLGALRLGVDVVDGTDPLGALVAALDGFAPDGIVDLSDAPIADGPTRDLLAAHALARGVEYRGADFVFRPPPRPRVAAKPSLAVIGTAKRAGKTAIAAAAARALAGAGRTPVLVTMGRGGPAEPELIDPRTTPLDARALITRARTGRHAASDHVEDALTAGVVTIGTRRAGGGLGGTPASSTFVEGVELANRRPEPFMVLEGSGSAIPPVHADVTVCVVPGAATVETTIAHLGAVRLLLADLVVVTVGPVPSPTGAPEEATEVLERSGLHSELVDRIRSLVPAVPLLPTMLRVQPLASVEGRTVFFATTAPEPVAAWQASELASRHRAQVTGWTGELAHRDRLERDLATAQAEVLVTELKAGAVEIAVETALDRGMEVVFCDNKPDPSDELDDAIQALAQRAVDAFAAR